MILNNYKIRRYSTETKLWDILELNKKEYHTFIKSHYKLPGNYNLDYKVDIILSAKNNFVEYGHYCDYSDDTEEYDAYWEEEAFKCVHGVLVDDLFVTGSLYFYVNYLQINDKVKGIQFFPNFWDSDIWFFYCLEIAQLEDKDLAIVKKRQYGASYKLCAYIIRTLWFSSSKVCKIFNVDITYVEDAFSFMDDFKQFLNEHTGWYRPFSPEVNLYWKQQQEITKESGNAKKSVKQGRKNVVKGLTTQKKASALVSGACSFYFAEECGKNPTLDKSYNFAQKAMRFGNIKTGFFVASGAVGAMSECEPLKKFIMNPRANGFLEFPNVWSNRPDEMIGMFIPEYYSYGDCIDKWGNSLIEEAKVKIAEWLESIKEKSLADYLAEKSQAPCTIEDCFSIQEENIFPIEIIQPHYERLQREYTPLRVTLTEDLKKDSTGITHKLGSEASPVRDFPVKKDTDRRGCIEIVEPPLYAKPPIGLYYGSCDPVTQIKTETSSSLQSFYIYRADYYQDDILVPGQLVAWYCGRYDNVDITYEMCRKLMVYYNARTMIESDKDGFIKWLITKKENFFLMKRSEYPRLQEIVPNSKIFEDYGIRKGSSKTFENHLLETVIRYVSEEIGTDYDKEGNSKPRYGVERIKDIMLLKEMLDYNSKGNFDRLFSFAYVLDVAEGNTMRQRIQKIKEVERSSLPVYSTRIQIDPFSSMIKRGSSNYKIKQF